MTILGWIIAIGFGIWALGKIIGLLFILGWILFGIGYAVWALFRALLRAVFGRKE